MFTYKTQGTCASQIDFDVKDDIITKCNFVQGCRGNAAGVCRMVEGQHIDTVINKLSGIQCRLGTSCPDQLAKALIKYKSRQ